MIIENGESMICEENGINLKNEKSLHASIKKWYAKPGDRFEAKVGSHIVDIVRGDLLIEIQTVGFSSIRNKLRKLTEKNQVRLVHPIAREKIIIRTNASGDYVLSSRKSTKTGKLIDIFRELISMPSMINEANFSLEVLMIKVEELRCEDGKGSWRRRKVSIQDRKLIEVFESFVFNTRQDFLQFLPQGLCKNFTTKDLAEISGYKVNECQRIAYCLKKMGAIREVGKKGRCILYEIEE